MNPLRKLHEQAEAEFQAYGDMEIVSTFGEPQAEYAAIHKACALIDSSQRGVLQATGPDRISFLNRFLTNQLMSGDGKTPLPPGTGIYGFLLNNKGRIVSDMNVLQQTDRALLASDARNIAALRDTLQKYVFSEKVEFTDLTESTHQFSLHGPRSHEVVKLLFGNEAELPSLGSILAKFQNSDVTIWRDDPCGVPGYNILIPFEHAPSLWMNALSAFPANEPGKRAVRPAGWAVFNTARIEAGRPLFGIDFDDTILPAETGQLARAVSFTKGCYLGQEIVARMHARNQLARQIDGIRMREDALPIAGAPIVDSKKNQIGGITSSTISPILSGASICLGLVKSAFSAIGTEVLIAAEGAFRTGIITELPFVSHPATAPA